MEEIKMNQKFVICEHCGNIATLIKDSGVPMMCCGEKMKELVPGVIEASHEKHIPVFEVEDNKVIVKIGSIDHPMIPEHYIEWVVLQTKKGTQIFILNLSSFLSFYSPHHVAGILR